MNIGKIRRVLRQAERLLGIVDSSHHGRRGHHYHHRRRRGGFRNAVLRQIFRRIR